MKKIMKSGLRVEASHKIRYLCASFFTYVLKIWFCGRVNLTMQEFFTQSKKPGPDVWIYITSVSI
jgi:hypothetical protein